MTTPLSDHEKREYLGDVFIRSLVGVAPGLNYRYNANGWQMREALEFGRLLRDDWQHKFAILPGALNSFVEVSASKEWMIIGKPRVASRAVERLNNAFFVDAYGIEHRGWETVVSRMCMDWLTIGRCGIHAPMTAVGRNSIEYLDTGYMTPVRRNNQARAEWQYHDVNSSHERYLSQDDVFFNDCIRLGATGTVLGKVAWLIPIARLEWYLREHMSAKLDGRKIRDIFFVADDQMVAAVEDALTSAIALANGEDPSKYGLPVVAVNALGVQMPVEDMFARLGLSEIPESLDPEKLENRYVNEISSVLGLGIRYFWNPSSSSSRSLEQISEERQEKQGPSFFLHSIERMINTGNLLSSPRNKVRFQVEESKDTAAQEREAKTFKTFVEGLTLLYNMVSPPMVPEPQGMVTKNPDGTQSVGEPPKMVPQQRENAGIMSPASILAFLEREGYLSTDLTLPDLMTLEESGIDPASENGDVLDRGEVRLNRDGRVLERRFDHYTTVIKAVS